MPNSHHRPPYPTLCLRKILHVGWILGQISIWSWKVVPGSAHALVSLEEPPAFDRWNDHHQHHEETMRLESRAAASSVLRDKIFIPAIATTGALVLVAFLCCYMLGWCFNRKQMDAYWSRAAYPPPRTNNLSNLGTGMGTGMGTFAPPTSHGGSESDSWRRQSKVQRKPPPDFRNTPPHSPRPGPSSSQGRQHPIYNANSISYADAVVGAYPGSIPGGSYRNQAGSTRHSAIAYQQPPMAPVYGYQPNTTSNPNPGVLPNQFYPGAATSSASYAPNLRYQNQNTPKAWGAKLAARFSALSSGASSTQVASDQLSYVSDPPPLPQTTPNPNTTPLPGSYPQSQPQPQPQSQPYQPEGPSNRQPYYAYSSSSQSNRAPVYPQTQMHPQTQAYLASQSQADAAGGEFNPYQYSQTQAGGSQHPHQNPIILPNTKTASASGHGAIPPYSSSHGHGDGAGGSMGHEYKGDVKSALPRTPSQAGW